MMFAMNGCWHAMAPGAHPVNKMEVALTSMLARSATGVPGQVAARAVVRSDPGKPSTAGMPGRVTEAVWSAWLEGTDAMIVSHPACRRRPALAALAAETVVPLCRRRPALTAEKVVPTGKIARVGAMYCDAIASTTSTVTSTTGPDGSVMRAPGWVSRVL